MRADAFLPIIQQEAVAVVVVAALMHQPPDGPVMRVRWGVL